MHRATRYILVGTISTMIAPAILAISNDAAALRNAFEGLVSKCTGTYTEAMAREFSSTTQSIQSAPRDELRGALPLILRRYSALDERTKSCTTVFLYAVSLRPDSAQILEEHVKTIGELFELSDERLQGAAVIILAGLQPGPPAHALELITGYLRRSDASPKMQAMAIGYILRAAPNSAEGLTAIREFLARPLDVETRIATLYSLGARPGLRDSELTAAVLVALDDPDASVRSAAAQALRAFGKAALQKAEPKLRALVTDDEQPDAVRRAAEDALTTMERLPE